MIDQLSKIEIDTLKHFNNFLYEMDQIKEGDGTLLDHTTIVMGSNFGDASRHTCNNLPIIVAGEGTVTSPSPLPKNKPLFVIFISNYFTEIILMLVLLGVAPQT